MTLGDMLADVADNLRTAGVNVPPNAVMVRKLNQAKDRVVAHLERCNSELFTVRSDISVTGGQTSIDLPTGIVRLIGVDRVTGNIETPIDVIGTRQRSGYAPDRNWPYDETSDASSCGPMYMEGGKLYAAAAGGLAAGTIRLRYRKRVDDLAESRQADSYSGVPTEWQPMITAHASMSLLPAGNADFGRHRDDYDRMASESRISLARRSDTRAPNILDNVE